MDRLLDLPASLADLTPAWLSRALQADVVAITVDGIVRGTATKARVALRYAPGSDPALPASVCVKGGLDEPHAAALAKQGSYRIEGLFYRDLAPCLPIVLPRVHHVALDEASGHCLIVMEDLVAAGATFLRATDDTLTPAQVASLLVDMALLHARWWGRREIDWLDTGMDHGSPLGEYFASYTPAMLAEYLTRRGEGLSSANRDPARLHVAFWRLQAGTTAAPLCVLHGDAHVGNVYRFPNGRVALCDWQAMMWGQWSHDVAYLIGSALDPALRGSVERPLLDGYLRALRGHGVAAPDGDAAWATYRRAMLYGLYGWLTNPLCFQPEAISAATTRRFARAVEELDSIGLLLGQ